MYKNYHPKVTMLLGITISIVYSLAYNAGLYGFAIDYWSSYHKSNLFYATQLFDILGWILATLTVANVHIGVFITSLLLSLSSFLLIIKSNISKNGLVVILGFIVLLHTWPILMSASNGMRQGIMISFIFLALSSFDSNKILTSIFLLLALFSHNSGIIFVSTFLGVWMVVNFLSPTRYLLVATVLASSLVIWHGIPLFYAMPEGGSSRIIAGDFRYPFLAINFFTSIFLISKIKILDNFLSLYVFYLNSLLPVFLFLGLNWQYERLNQVLLIPTILVLAAYFKYSKREGVVLLVFFLLFILTIYTGMFTALHNQSPL